MLQSNQADRSIGELVGDLTRDIGTLVREEINLARTEMTQKAANVGKNIGSLAVGGILAFAGLLGLEASAIAALARVLDLWAAALIVGALLLIVATALVMKGLKALKQNDMVPRQTIETLQEDAQWAKQQVK